MERKAFIAGSTGAVGKTLVRRAESQRVPLLAHVRPRPGVARGSFDRKFDLEDVGLLTKHLSECTTVVQLIGTVRARFKRGDTYEVSDIGTTRLLVEAAQRAQTIDHFVLLSSVGAGRPLGAYLKAKAEAERLVRESGIPYTIFRPSAFIGGGHELSPILRRVSGLFEKYRPIHVSALAGAILRSVLERAPLNAIVEGGSLWELSD